jgi:hypothetical protein
VAALRVAGIFSPSVTQALLITEQAYSKQTSATGFKLIEIWPQRQQDVNHHRLQGHSYARLGSPTSDGRRSALLLDLKGRKRILNVGCGNGKITAVIAGESWLAKDFCHMLKFLDVHLDHLCRMIAMLSLSFRFPLDSTLPLWHLRWRDGCYPQQQAIFHFSQRHSLLLL